MLIPTILVFLLGAALETHCSLWVESFFAQYNLKGCNKHLQYRLSAKNLLQECREDPHTVFSKLEIAGESCFK